MRSSQWATLQSVYSDQVVYIQCVYSDQVMYIQSVYSSRSQIEQKTQCYLHYLFSINK